MPRRPFLALIAGGLAAGATVATTTAQERDAAVFAGEFVWQERRDGFGGFSGFDLGADGLSFSAITDRGHVAEGVLTRDTTGAVSGVRLTAFGLLRHPNGGPMKPEIANAEGLARLENGSFYVSFEYWHRVEHFASADAPAERLPIPRDFEGLQDNSGLEALAVDAEGRVYAIPERSGSLGRPFPVYRFDGSRWDVPFTLPREGDFLPVGADFGPDGRLYLLERDFRGFLGFRSRVSRFALGPDGPGAREVLIETRGPLHDNLESISVWTDPAGALRLTMLSDDNFAFFQRTEFVDYVVTDALAKAAGGE